MPGMNIYQVLLAFTSIYYIQALPLHVSNDLELHESSAAFTGSIFTVKPVKSTGSSPKPKPVTLPVKKDCDKEWTKCVYETFDMRHCSNEKRKCLGKGEEADLELHESSAAFTGSIFTVKPVKSTGSSPKPKPVTLPVKKDCDKEWTKCVYETFDMRHCSNEKRKCLGKGEVQEWLQLADREEAEKPAEEEDEEAPEGEDDEAPEEEDDEGFEEIQEQLDNPNETGEGWKFVTEQ